MTSDFESGKSDEARASETEIEKLHSKVGPLAMEWDFLASALHQLLGTRDKMVSADHELSLRREYTLLRLTRSGCIPGQSAGTCLL